MRLMQIRPRIGVPGEESDRDADRLLGYLAVLAVVSGILFRTLWLEQIPPGFDYDEGLDSLDAWEVAQGRPQVYFERSGAREPLWMYWVAPFVGVLGTSVTSVRLASAAMGILSLLAVYPFVRRLLDELDPAFSRRAALLATAGLSLSFWHTALSRLGLRQISWPLLEILVFLMLWAIIRQLDEDAPFGRAKVIRAVLLGLLVGLSLYTYNAARVLPVLLAAWLVVLLVTDRSLLRRLVPSVALAGVAAAIVLLPLVSYYRDNPEIVTLRMNSLQVWTPTWSGDQSVEVLRRNFAAVLGMFTVFGDPDARWNLPGKPVFDLATGFLAAVGLVWMIAHIRKAWSSFVLLAITVAILPTALAPNAPNFSRASGVLPIVYLFPALGLTVSMGWIESRGVRTRWAVAAASALVVVWGATTAWDYFIRLPAHPSVRGEFAASAVTAAREALREAEGSVRLGSSLNERLYPNLAFLARTVPQGRWFDATAGFICPGSTDRKLTYVLIGANLDAYQEVEHLLSLGELAGSGQREAVKWRSYLWDEALGIPSACDGRSLDRLAGWSDELQFPEGAKGLNLRSPVALPASFSGFADLQGYAYENADESDTGPVLRETRLEAMLLWQSSRVVNKELRLSMQVLDDRGQLVGQQDKLSYPSIEWTAGTLFLEWFSVPLPEALPAGVYQVQLLMYRIGDLRRYPPIIDGEPAPHSRLLLRPFTYTIASG